MYESRRVFQSLRYVSTVSLSRQYLFESMLVVYLAKMSGSLFLGTVINWTNHSMVVRLTTVQQF